jgi:hypothetical protein
MTKSRRLRWVRHVAQKGKRNVYRILVAKQERRRPLGRPRGRRKDTTEMDLMEIGWGGIDWIHLA